MASKDKITPSVVQPGGVRCVSLRSCDLRVNEVEMLQSQDITVRVPAAPQRERALHNRLQETLGATTAKIFLSITTAQFHYNNKKVTGRKWEKILT